MTQRSVSSPRSPLRFLPTPRDRSILETIATHGRMTRSQIQRLFFRREDGVLASNQAVLMGSKSIPIGVGDFIFFHPWEGDALLLVGTIVLIRNGEIVGEWATYRGGN